MGGAERGGGAKSHMQISNVKKLSGRRSQTVCACYLNISGARIERVQGCSLTSLCLASAASDSQRISRGIITAPSPRLGNTSGGKRLIQTASFQQHPLLFFFLKGGC